MFLVPTVLSPMCPLRFVFVRISQEKGFAVQTFLDVLAHLPGSLPVFTCHTLFDSSEMPAEVMTGVSWLFSSKRFFFFAVPVNYPDSLNKVHTFPRCRTT